jgi:SAM-dependent methyltransferase
VSAAPLSRRGLLGAGLRRALEARLDAEESVERARPNRSWNDDRSLQLGSRLEPVAEEMLELAAVDAGQTVLAATAANDTLAKAAARRAAAVATADSMAIDWPNASFDAVLAFFGVTSYPDRRSTANELKRVARPGAPIVLASWSDQPWARYETAYRHFFDYPDLDVLDRTLPDLGASYAIVFARKP